MIRYYALSHHGSKDNWTIYAMAETRELAETRGLHQISEQYPNPTDIWRDTYQKNLQIVSETRVKRDPYWHQALERFLEPEDEE